jgi:hypothetical protein
MNILGIDNFKEIDKLNKAFKLKSKDKDKSE